MSWERFFEITFGVKPDAPAAPASSPRTDAARPSTAEPAAAPATGAKDAPTAAAQPEAQAGK